MNKVWHYDIALWQVHDTENDCDLIIRSNSGYVFYCHICPSQFIRSPSVAAQYFKCLQLLRSGEVEIDDFYEDDAFEWLLGCFEPLITNLALYSDLDVVSEPTLADYFFPKQSFVCSLTALDDELMPQELETKNHGWSSPIVKFDDDFLEDLNTWTECYTPSQVKIGYAGPEESLIKPPKRTTVTGKYGEPTTCFFKKFGLSCGQRHARKELLTLKNIIEAQIPSPPEAYICRLMGVVRQGDGLLGMLFAWIPNKGVLSRARAAASPPELSNRWATQIQRSVDLLHKKGIVWGDAKAENVLIDQNDDAWVVDFGGGYTIGWVDDDKAGTLEGDRQGLVKIINMLV
ncbi:serine threonine kinase [Fusarium phyllophilum]|uniref:Serine threonine kinase n=1 Tax=Fusarium phyllophilum TaxID=47803 RepID=A0A8H5JU65_9HYPO|nr:serine threonine kinase [Fusarium phyllophilum]